MLLWFPSYETVLISPFSSAEVVDRLRKATKGRFAFFGPSDVIAQFSKGAIFLTYAPWDYSADPALRLTMEILVDERDSGSSLFCLTHCLPLYKIGLVLWYSAFFIVGCGILSAGLFSLANPQANESSFMLIIFGLTWLAGIVTLWTSGLSINETNHVHLIRFLQRVLDAEIERPPLG